MQCCIEHITVDISSVEVVPILLVTSLSWDHAELGTTSAVRNLQ
ncbi:hypothetical protein [Clostridium beijerinckii]|nr:hypothetical protein [Clostridium beijerinckii]